MRRFIGFAIIAFIVWAVIRADDVPSPDSTVSASSSAPAAPAAAPSTTSAPADKSVDNAFRVCQVFDNTGLGSAPCEVSGWNATVTATIDMTSAEARLTCAQVVDALRDKKLRFERRWTLQIRSPYSGDKSIAFCKLPS